MKNIILKYKLFKKQFIENEEDPEWTTFHYPSYLDKLKDDLYLWHNAFLHTSVTYIRLYSTYKKIEFKIKKMFIKEVVVEKVADREPPPKPMVNCWCHLQDSPFPRKHHLN